MLKQVSWADYFAVVALLMVVYYSAVILLFYRDDIGKMLTGNRKFFTGREAAITESEN